MRVPATSPSAPGAAPAAGDLVTRLQQGEAAAFEELVRSEGPRLLAVARRFLPHEADAEDALQDAFVNVSRSIGSFQRGSLLSTWLHRVVVNAALMRIRSRDRRPERSVEDGTLEAAAERRSSGDWSFSAADLLAGREVREIVREEIARLPDPYRVVLLLRDMEGVDPAAIAALVGVGLTTVKMRLQRGRRALRAALEPRLKARKEK